MATGHIDMLDVLEKAGWPREMRSFWLDMLEKAGWPMEMRSFWPKKGISLVEFLLLDLLPAVMEVPIVPGCSTS